MPISLTWAVKQQSPRRQKHNQKKKASRRLTPVR
jgi:hypothetical protein